MLSPLKTVKSQRWLQRLQEPPPRLRSERLWRRHGALALPSSGYSLLRYFPESCVAWFVAPGSTRHGPSAASRRVSTLPAMEKLSLFGGSYRASRARASRREEPGASRKRGGICEGCAVLTASPPRRCAASAPGNGRPNLRAAAVARRQGSSIALATAMFSCPRARPLGPRPENLQKLLVMSHRICFCIGRNTDS